MSPVWLEQQQFEYIGELGQVWLEVQHREQVLPPPALFHPGGIVLSENNT